MRPSEYESLTSTEAQKALKALRSALKKMRNILRRKTATEFDRATALARKQAIEREIDALENELLVRVGKAAKRAGPKADELNREAPMNPVGIDANVVARAEANAARMVRGVTERMRRDLNQAVTKAVTGELDRQELEQGIADALDVDVAEARVDRIVRTELGEVFELQGAEADARLAEQGADLIKVWSHKCGGRMCLGARPEHVALHGQERELWEPFNVGDGATDKTPPGGVGREAMRPLDPALPAKDRIHCGCTARRVPRAQAKQAYTANVNPRARPAEMRVAASRAESV